MKGRSAGELAFESFCALNSISCERLAESDSPTPDFKIEIYGSAIYVEVKDIEADEDFTPVIKHRIMGDHVRGKIIAARRQMQMAARRGAPAVLLIHSALDPMQAFGTEETDFIAAMYGEPTMVLSLEARPLRVVDAFDGRDRSVTPAKNTSFSAVGLIQTRHGAVRVHIYENIHAKYPLDYVALPSCVDAKRMRVVNRRAHVQEAF